LASLARSSLVQWL